jgi:uncharacterized protein (DUF305 family)
MLDALLALVKTAEVAQPMLHVANIMATVENLMKMVGSDIMKSGDAKNAAIDFLCQLLQSHKDGAVTTKIITPTIEIPNG